MTQPLHEDPDTVFNKAGEEVVTYRDAPNIAFTIWNVSGDNKPRLTFFNAGPYLISLHDQVDMKIEKELGGPGTSVDHLIKGKIWPKKKIAATYQNKSHVLDYRHLVEKFFKDVKEDIYEYKWDFNNSSETDGFDLWPAPGQSISRIGVNASKRAMELVNQLIQKMHLADPVEKVKLRKQIKDLQNALCIQDDELDLLPIAAKDMEKQYGSIAAAQFARGSIAENTKETLRVYNKTLDPKIWDDRLQIDEEIRKTLLQVGEDFYASTDLQGEIVNIYLVGLAANYNWTPESDLDIHVIIDISKENINPKYARKFMDSLTWAWNSIHDIEVKGHPVEVYLQDQTEPNGSPKVARAGVAIYSLRDNVWIVKPTPKQLSLDKDKIKTKFRELKARINTLINSDDFTRLKALMKRIKNYRNAGLKKEGEFGTENLVFKALRHTGMLEKLKDAIQTSYDRQTTIKEGISNSPFIITGMTSQDLDVAGEKYSGDQPMITHGSLMHRYGNWSGASHWRYRSDNNTIFWWGRFPDEDIKEATLDWLARKVNIKNPRHISSAQYEPDSEKYKRVSKIMHYPWAKSLTSLSEDVDESSDYYVVGIVTDDLNIVAKRYGKKENYITHDELYRLYGIQVGSGAGWRYHSLNNWIFWWEHPEPEQKEEVENYLKSKYKAINPRSQYPQSMDYTYIEDNPLKEDGAKIANDFLIIGNVTDDHEVHAVRKGSSDVTGNHTGWGKRWRYRSTSPEYVFWWEGPDDEDKESVTFYLYKRYGIKITKHKTFWELSGNTYDITSYLHGIEMPKPDINEEMAADTDIYIGFVNNDDLRVVAKSRKQSQHQATHIGLGSQLGTYSEDWDHFRFRKDKNVVYMKQPLSVEQKEAIKFWLEKNLKVNTDETQFVGGYSYNPVLSAAAHGMEEAKEKFNPFKAKKLDFVTYGGLSLTKQKGYHGPSELETFHSPPARRGIYAFVWPYVETFLLGGGYSNPKQRGKGQRQRIQYVRDKKGNIITSDHPEYDKYAFVQKNWTISRPKPGIPDDKLDSLDWKDRQTTFLYNNTSRKKFSYSGPLWHHLLDGVSQDKIIDEKGEWIKTDMATFTEALKKQLHANLTWDRGFNKGRPMAGSVKSGGIENLEVFIDQKI